MSVHRERGDEIRHIGPTTYAAESAVSDGMPLRSDAVDPFRARIAAERGRLHARSALAAAPVQLTITLCALLLVSDNVSAQVFAGLLAGMLAGFWWYVMTVRRLIRMAPTDVRMRSGMVRFGALASLLALALGLAVALMLPRLPATDRYMLTTVAVAYCVVATASHHASSRTLLAVGAAILGPIVIALLMTGIPSDLVIAVALSSIVSIAWYIGSVAGVAASEAIRDRLRVADLGQRLEVRGRELEYAVRAKSQFLAAVSHDLRQPVTSLDLLLSTLESPESADQGSTAPRPVEKVHASLAARMRPAVRAMGDILDSMLQMSQLESGMVGATVAPVDLRELLLSIQIEVAPRAQERGLSFATNAAAIVILSDRDLVSRIVRNLVDNAIKYTPQGSIVVGAWMEAEECVIAVQDTGLGISPELHQRIFEDYFQADNPNRDRGKGLGLGLSIVGRLVELLGGSIGLVSKPGSGSTFTVRLPAKPLALVDRPVARVPLTLSQALAGKKRLLVVEDDPLVRDAMASVLAEVRLERRVESNPHEALAVAASGFRPDVAIVDYRLPGKLNGLEVIAALQTLEPTLAAVLITGDLDPQLGVRAAALCTAVVNKPFDASRLADGVAQSRQLASGSVRKAAEAKV